MFQHDKQRGIPGWIKGLIVGLIVVGGSAGAVVVTTQPSFGQGSPTQASLDPSRLRAHVKMLSETLAPRDYRRYWNLEKTAGYISNHLARAGAVMSEQVFTVDDRDYRNVIATFGPTTPSRIIVGAHYDGCQDTPGADDNASGVAGLIELAYLLGKADLKQQVELVAYTLEEPPFFRTGNMGSARHAYQLRQDGVTVDAMICLEMIGYFSEEKGSQQFPSTFLKMLYPETGNFIAVIGRTGDHKLIRQLKTSMRGATDLPVEALCAPEGFPGIDFSDHLNFWNHGFSAVMVTDTAFFRNHRYHTSGDTVDTLNFDSMAKVVLGVYEAVLQRANGED